jgi:membrane carboxypeptidase/penicillin-binding protein
VGAAFGQSALVAGIDFLLPDARRLSSYNRPGTLTILSADGQVVQKIGPATREKLTAGSMPPLVEQAFIAAEDRRFYQHNGIDPMGIGRAMVRNLTQHSVEEGASTITQQLARTVFLSQDRTVLRKVAEVALAGKLERQLSKQQILEQYLNFVYLGSSAYGVADAAWVYFSKTPEQLTLAEAALIAGLPPAPSVYSPLINPDLALKRRAIVLRRMREAGFIDDVQLDRAQAGNILSRSTLSLFYATDFADQLENIIIPALRAGFIVLADRYIYTLMARDMVRGMNGAWLKNLYGIALEPDAVFYLSVEAQELVQRNLAKSATLDYWESGMDLGLSRDVFDSFLKYQTAMQLAFRQLQKTYGFTIMDGNRSVDSVTRELRTKITGLLAGA